MMEQSRTKKRKEGKREGGVGGRGEREREREREREHGILPRSIGLGLAASMMLIGYRSFIWDSESTLNALNNEPILEHTQNAPKTDHTLYDHI